MQCWLGISARIGASLAVGERLLSSLACIFAHASRAVGLSTAWDLQGDLALLATPGTRGLPIGHIMAHNADHALNIEFAKALRDSCTEDDLVDAAAQPQEEVVLSDQQEQPQAVQAS